MKTLSDLLASTNKSGRTFAFENDILQEAVENSIANHRKRAVAACETMIGDIYAIKEGYANVLRRIRDDEEKAKKQMDKVEAAAQHLGKTGNPLPFFKATGQMNKALEFCNAIRIPCPDEKSDAWNC